MRSSQNLRKDRQSWRLWHCLCRTHTRGDLLLPPPNVFLSLVIVVVEPFDTWSAGAKQHHPWTQQKSLQKAQKVTLQSCHIQSRIDRVSDYCMRWCVPVKLRRLDSDSSWFKVVSMMVFYSSFQFQHAVLNLFSPLQTRSPPQKYAWQQPTSIVDLIAQEPRHFFFRKAGQIWTLSKEHKPNYYFEKGRKTSRQTTDKWPDKKFLRSSASIGPQLQPWSRSRLAL